MIPVAYFFVDEKLARYENYSSTSSEYFTHEEVFSFEDENHKTLQTAAVVVDHFSEFKYVFAIYNPNEKQMFLAKLGDTDTIKMIVDTQEKTDKVAYYCFTLIDLGMLFEKADDLYSFDFDFLIKHNKTEYKESAEICDEAMNAYMDNITNMMDLCIADFRKEFLF